MIVQCRFLLLITSTLYSHQGKAQFTPYSQYEITTSFTNPANAGLGDFTSVIFNYRASAIADYEMPSVTLDYPLFDTKLQRRIGGINLSLINETIGPSNLFKISGIYGGAAYSLPLNRFYELNFGLQGAYINKRVDISAITTDNQFEYGAFDPSIPTGENFQSGSAESVAINAGINWQWIDATRKRKALLGVALYQINRPAFNFLFSENKEPITIIASGEVAVYDTEKLSINPTFRYLYLRSNLLNAGVVTRYVVDRLQWHELGFGVWYQTNKTLVLNLQLTHPSYLISVSSDFSMGPTSGGINNAFEISIGWRLNRYEKLKQKRVDKKAE